MGTGRAGRLGTQSAEAAAARGVPPRITSPRPRRKSIEPASNCLPFVSVPRYLTLTRSPDLAALPRPARTSFSSRPLFVFCTAGAPPPLAAPPPRANAATAADGFGGVSM